MSYNPLKSRRFWTLIATLVIDLVSAAVAYYVHDPFALQAAAIIIPAATGIGGVLIAAYTVDDTASNVTAIKAGSHPDYPKQG